MSSTGPVKYSGSYTPKHTVNMDDNLGGDD